MGVTQAASAKLVADLETEVFQPARNRSRRHLPDGVSVERGRIEVRFDGAEDALARLYTLGMWRQDYFGQGSRGWSRLHEKGGKRHDVPAHHRAAAALDAYVAAGALEEPKAALFQTVDPAGRRLTGRALDSATRAGDGQASGAYVIGIHTRSSFA